jgi:hypothetical protein
MRFVPRAFAVEDHQLREPGRRPHIPSLAAPKRRANGKARPLLLAAVGGEPSDAAAVWEYGAADRGAGGADGVEDWDWQANIWGRKRAEAGTTFWRSL